MTREEQMMDLARLAELNSRTIDLSKKQVFMSAYIQGLEDADSHPQWHDAQGDNVPEYGREVIVIGRDGKVFFGHRPDPKEVTMIDGKPYHAKTYDKNGWNWPDIALWLDVEVPDELIDKITTEYFKENGQKGDSK